MQNDMRTPLSRVRGLGSAKDGTQHFWHQRLTAMALIPLVLYFLFIIVQVNGQGYDFVVACLSKPSVSILMLLFVGAGLYHMKLGMQVVIEDYVHGGWGKTLLVLNTFFCLGLAVACAFAILKLGFGG